MTESQKTNYRMLVEHFAKRNEQRESNAAAAKKETLKEETELESLKKTDPEEKSKKKTDPEDNSNNILMELRKAANHPLLRRTIYNGEKIEQMAKLIMKVIHELFSQ